jgi:IS30 family transposase
LERYLFWKRNKKKSGHKLTHASAKDQEKRMIEARPPFFSSGHWELDFIISRQSSSVLMVMVDRWTRFAIINRLERKTHQGVLDALANINRRYFVKTITTDNDIVLRNWQEMEVTLSVLFYFCHPYHSWEKGLVENTNRWIRCFVPKRRDISTVSNDELRSIETYLNETPRQCLGYMTAQEVLLNS